MLPLQVRNIFILPFEERINRLDRADHRYIHLILLHILQDVFFRALLAQHGLAHVCMKINNHLISSNPITRTAF